MDIKEVTNVQITRIERGFVIKFIDKNCSENPFAIICITEMSLTFITKALFNIGCVFQITEGIDMGLNDSVIKEKLTEYIKKKRKEQQND